jgi:hypothetical protein
VSKTEDKPKRKVTVTKVLEAGCLVLVVAIIAYAAITDSQGNSSKTGFNPATDVCTARLPFFEPVKGVVVSCYGVFVTDFPNCCSNWTAREHRERYASCADEMFEGWQVGIYNSTEAFNVTFGRCLNFDKTDFLDRVSMMAEMHRLNHANSTNGGKNVS